MQDIIPHAGSDASHRCHVLVVEYRGLRVFVRCIKEFPRRCVRRIAVECLVGAVVPNCQTTHPCRRRGSRETLRPIGAAAATTVAPVVPAMPVRVAISPSVAAALPIVKFRPAVAPAFPAAPRLNAKLTD